MEVILGVITIKFMTDIFPQFGWVCVSGCGV